jgi:hypothetical protein
MFLVDMICIYDSQDNTENNFAASVYFPEFMRVRRSKTPF